MVDPAHPDSSAPLEDHIAALHDHLSATGERPVETRASRWIGEAEAVVADVDGGDPPPGVVSTRISQAADLLSNVDATGDPTADRHLRQARALVEQIQSRLGDTDADPTGDDR